MSIEEIVANECKKNNSSWFHKDDVSKIVRDILLKVALSMPEDSADRLVVSSNLVLKLTYKPNK